MTCDKKPSSTPALRLLTLSTLLAFNAMGGAATAAILDGGTDLQSADVKVTADEMLKDKADDVTLSGKKLQDQMVRNAKDLTRYDTELGVVQSSRSDKGFSMRGVEGNRVGITVDGMQMSSYEDNSLYSLFSNFNTSRPNVDSELVGSIDVTHGSASLKNGSGALGGNVGYNTLKPSDIVQEGNTLGLLGRTGYASANREWFQTVGVGTMTDRWETLVLYSHRYGHEYKSLGRITNPDDQKGVKSERPDPQQHHYHSALAKAKLHLNDTHALGVEFNGQYNRDEIHEKSYDMITYSDRFDRDRIWRYAGKVFYEFTPEDSIIESGKVSFDTQHSSVEGHSWQYRESFYRDYQLKFNELNHTHLDVPPEEALAEQKNRYMIHQDYHLNGELVLTPFEWLGGEHEVEARSFVSYGTFKNKNVDYFYSEKFILADGEPEFAENTVPGSWVSGRNGTWNNIHKGTQRSTIQYPTATRSIGFTLLDHSAWDIDLTENVPGRILVAPGIRMQYDRHSPRKLNEEAGAAVTRGGVPSVARFFNVAGALDLGLEIDNTWKTGYQIASGFRSPTSSEMYFTFDSTAGTWEANPDLKAEKSLTHTLYLQGSGKAGYLDASLYYTSYKNFLEEDKYVREILEDHGFWGGIKVIKVPAMRMINEDSAKIYGLNVRAGFNLSTIDERLNGWAVNGVMGYAKGKLGDGRDILAVQPIKLVGGIDYTAPSDRWAVSARYTYIGRKKASDAMSKNFIKGRDSSVTEAPYPYLSNSAKLVDLFGWYSPKKNVKIRAGVFNLFNHKWSRWDSLRNINEFGSTNMVDSYTGQGLERYVEPGRNFSVSLEMKF